MKLIKIIMVSITALTMVFAQTDEQMQQMAEQKADQIVDAMMQNLEKMMDRNGHDSPAESNCEALALGLPAFQALDENGEPEGQPMASYESDCSEFMANLEADLSPDEAAFMEALDGNPDNAQDAFDAGTQKWAEDHVNPDGCEGSDDEDCASPMEQMVSTIALQRVYDSLQEKGLQPMGAMAIAIMALEEMGRDEGDHDGQDGQGDHDGQDGQGNHDGQDGQGNHDGQDGQGNHDGMTELGNVRQGFEGMLEQMAADGNLSEEDRTFFSDLANSLEEAAHSEHESEENTGAAGEVMGQLDSHNFTNEDVERDVRQQLCIIEHLTHEEHAMNQAMDDGEEFQPTPPPCDGPDGAPKMN